MKTRQGFVSNSSSTSFSVFGIHASSKEIDSLLDSVLGPVKTTRDPGCECNINRDESKFCPECGKQTWITTTEERDDLCEYAREIETKLGLEVISWNGGENCGEGTYIGKNLRYWSKELPAIEKIEILGNVNNRLVELFPDKKANFFSDGTYDG